MEKATAELAIKTQALQQAENMVAEALQRVTEAQQLLAAAEREAQEAKEVLESVSKKLDDARNLASELDTHLQEIQHALLVCQKELESRKQQEEASKERVSPPLFWCSLSLSYFPSPLLPGSHIAPVDSIVSVRAD